METSVVAAEDARGHAQIGGARIEREVKGELECGGLGCGRRLEGGERFDVVGRWPFGEFDQFPGGSHGIG